MGLHAHGKMGLLARPHYLQLCTRFTTAKRLLQCPLLLQCAFNKITFPRVKIMSECEKTKFDDTTLKEERNALATALDIYVLGNVLDLAQHLALHLGHLSQFFHYID